MRLAFCLFNYFPFGGLQRDFLRIAKTAMARSHMVDVYTMVWDGPYEPGLAIRVLPVRGIYNHTRREDFVRQLRPYLEQGHYDAVVGFNKMPGLTIYYAADTCYQAKARAQHNWFYRLTRRYRQGVAFEKAVFGTDAKTEILLLSAAQQTEFMRYYATSATRFHLLPPGIERNRNLPANATKIRQQTRGEFNITDNDFLLLAIGSGFKTKGLDRTLQALAALPADLKARASLFVIGKDNPKIFQRQAKVLGISKQVVFLGGREDVPQFLWAADLLLHPAYNENTGTVLLEALTAGLPIITTDVCGYAHYVTEAAAGVVLPTPFDQLRFNMALTSLLSSAELRASAHWNALAFAASADIYSMPEQAISLIETL